MSTQTDILLDNVNTPNIEDFYEPEGRAVPVHLIREAIASAYYLSKISRALEILFTSGARLSEVKKMHLKARFGNFQAWKLGKNQTGMMRQEYFPDSLWTKILRGMDKDKHSSDLICDLEGKTILRYFNRDIRPHLSLEWRQKVRVLRNKGGSLSVGYEYKYQLKGFRKTFATLMFAYFWKKYGSADIALEKVSKRMKHNSKWMTMNHYVDMCRQIDAMKYCDQLPFEHLSGETQSNIADFMHLPNHLMEFDCRGRPPK